MSVARPVDGNERRFCRGHRRRCDDRPSRLPIVRRTNLVIRLEPHPAGVILDVRAQASARRDEIRSEYAGALKVAVTQAPEKGKANQAIAELLAKYLQLRKSQVELLSGAT